MQELQETCFWSLGQKDPLEEGMATHSGLLAWRIIGQRSPEGTESQSRTWQRQLRTHTHTHSTLTQRTVSGNLCCHHPLPYVAPGIQVDVVEFQPLAMAEGPWCWDWMPTPKCPSIKQLEPPIRLMSTSLLVYLETSELAEYTPLRLWSLSGPSLSHFLVYEEQHLGGGGGWRPHIPAPLVKRGLTYTSFHALSFWHCQLTKHSKKRSSSV